MAFGDNGIHLTDWNFKRKHKINQEGWFRFYHSYIDVLKRLNNFNHPIFLVNSIRHFAEVVGIYKQPNSGIELVN